MASTPQLPAPEIQPTSPQFMRAYGRFWDVLSVLIFTFAALFILYSEREALMWQHWAAAGLMVAQGGLYILAIALRGWPIPRVWLALYFIGGVSMWLAAGVLYPSTWWIGMTYFGQMFGLLPPPAVISGSFIINILIILYASDWNVANVTPGMLFGFGFQWLGGMAVYLFIYNIIRTSQGRGELVAKLEAAQRELQASREREVELAALRERERLARDLHDSLGHALVAMTVQLEAIQRLYRVDPERGSAQIDELKALTRRSMADLRRSLDGLRAPGLGEHQLSEALQALSVEVGQRAKLHIESRVPPEVDALSPAVQEALWRVAQESLTNVEKHARARHVHLQAEVQPHAASLVIKDDGVGIPPLAELQRGHYGLRGMRERVEGLGGTLTLQAANPGTVVEAQLPIITTALITNPQ
ncbi:MAG: sensor histidine kinase [Anaerolineales bacterium]|nr:sensor histidine kinase [Anaerolineales bacterium]